MSENDESVSGCDDDGEFTMDELVEGLRDLMDGMPAKWDRVGRLAVLFGACFHASGLTMREAERSFLRLKGATEWQEAHNPADGEAIH